MFERRYKKRQEELAKNPSAPKPPRPKPDPAKRESLERARVIWEEIRNTPRPKLPPWIEYPRYGRFSAAWRMGEGEACWLKWQEWYAELSEVEKKAYQKKYPTPLSWWGFYRWQTGKT